MTKSPPGKTTEPNAEQEPKLFDPVALGRALAQAAERARPLIQKYLDRAGKEGDHSLDPMNMGEAYAEFLGKLWADPSHLWGLQMDFWQQWVHLTQESMLHFLGEPHEDLYKPDKGDRRFKDAEWQQSALFDYIKQSYLLTSRWMQHAVNSTRGLDEKTKQKLDFSTRQFVNALSPSNFILTNPEVLRETMDSGGENLIKGLQNLLEDLERGRGELKISTTDYTAFEPGRNIAVTPGKIVYQNDLMQLIQYEPSTPQVYKRPLLIIPPWINKYYILDLRPDNSFIKWIVGQGHTVFTISWVNPDRKLAKKRFEDYMHEGVLDALDQIQNITGEKDCNIVGYCLGGTLLTITLAWLADQKLDKRVASATFLTTLVDFRNAGELTLFVDDEQLALMDREMAEKGYLEAKSLQKTFSMLRANDLIWSFVVNNYLMGKEPFPFDLLYWNDDSTNMPAAMHSFYLRKMYRDNSLIEPGGISMDKTPIDIRKIKTPAYYLSTREDHIAPWKATYAGTQLLSGPKTFTLAASGHIAGVVNPPAAKKYCYWTSSNTPPRPEAWLHKAKEQEGSWWPHWAKWLKDYAGPKIAPRKPGCGRVKPIEDAPGSYVKVKR